MNYRPWLWLLWLCIASLAAFLRLSDLSERPIHADEATGARIASNLLERGTYEFNPSHFHGPILSYSTWPIAKARSENKWSSLTSETLRFGPALAGLLLSLTPILWIRRIGNAPALLAASLLATSPLIVYYNRMYIHETWLALFGILSLLAGYRFLERPSIRSGLLTGLCLGLMFATKETFAISVISWGFAALLYLAQKFRDQGSLIQSPRAYFCYKSFLALTLSFFVVAALLYTNFLKHPSGILNAFLTYFQYETTSGHDKVFTYYLHLLVWPKQSLGLIWTEGAIALLALWALRSAKNRSGIRPVVIFLALSIVVHLAIYSAIAYKTPWLMLLPWAHVCFLAGLAVYNYGQFRIKWQIITAIALLAIIGFQTRQSIFASDRFANHERNPYSYVPTTQDPAQFSSWLKKITALPDISDPVVIAVIGQSYWPLPWYLRDFETVGYWPSAEEVDKFPAIVFAMPEETAACDTRLVESHQKFPRSLRSDVPVSLYLSNDLWNAWEEATE